MRVISMESGGNIKRVFARWAEAIQAVEASIKAEGYTYMYNEHLGNGNALLCNALVRSCVLLSYCYSVALLLLLTVQVVCS
jgi:ATP:guanido phosphotransferase, C-terminal catalytic domain